MRHLLITIKGNWTTRINAIINNNEIDREKITIININYNCYVDETSVEIYCRD